MTDLTVATTILQQLGGNRFRVMTGAKGFLGGADSLSFMIPRSRNVRKVVITLQPNDLYRVEFYKLNGPSSGLVQQYADVYAEDLPARFTEATGLATHL